MADANKNSTLDSVVTEIYGNDQTEQEEVKIGEDLSHSKYFLLFPRSYSSAKRIVLGELCRLKGDTSA